MSQSSIALGGTDRYSPAGSVFSISRGVRLKSGKTLAINPAEKPKSKDDLQASAFVNRHRIEPIGGRMPSAPRARG